MNSQTTPNPKLENQDAVFMHLIPFNEPYSERKNKASIVNTMSLADIKKAKGFLAARLKFESVEKSSTEKFRDIITRRDNTPYEKEIILKNYLISQYSLLPNSSCEYDKIDLTPHIEELFEKNYLHYLFRTSLKIDAQVQSLIKNNKYVFLVMGSDLIRLIDDKLRDFDAFNAFFDNYVGWPYVLEVDAGTCCRITKVLEISLIANFKKFGGITGI